MNFPSFISDVTKVIRTDHKITVEAYIYYIARSVQYQIPEQQYMIVCVTVLFLICRFNVNSVISGSTR